MGIVSKQASNAAIYSYVGVLIGFVNFTLLMANWFTPVQVGLREILLSVAVFGSQIAHLGTYRSVVKFYPFFKSDNKYDNGLLRIGLTVPFVGFILVAGFMLLFKPLIIGFYAEKSFLFVEYFWFSFPLLFLLMYNNVFESYLQARAKTAYSVFLKSVLTRLITSFLLGLYYLKVIDFYGFILLFISSYIITIILFIVYLFRRGEFSLTINPLFFTKRIRKVYLNYSGFSILSGISAVLANRLDALMIGGYIGLASTSVYANAVYLSVLVSIPGDSIGSITMPLLARSWKDKKMDEISELYKKTSATQFLLGGIILVLMWSSIDNFYQLQREEYAAGKLVFLILGSAKLINLLFGANGQIISISKFYRFDTTSAIALGILAIVTNHFFIPIWGIEGAAFATAISIVGFNIARFLFVLNKLKIQPFTSKTLIISGILVIGFMANEFIPHWKNFYIDTIARSILIGLILVVPSFLLKVSEDFNQMLIKNFKRVFN